MSKNNFEQAVDSIKLGWEHSWIKRLLNLTTMGRVLNNNYSTSVTRDFNFAQAYLSSNWLVRWWFRSYIQDKAKIEQFNSIINDIQKLKTFTLKDFSTIVNPVNSDEETAATDISNSSHQKDELISHESLRAQLFHAPSTNRTDNNKLAKSSTKTSSSALNDHECNVALLIGGTNPINTTIIKNHTKPRDAANALRYFKSREALTPEIQATIAAHPNPLELIESKKSALLNLWILQIMKAEDPQLLVEYLSAKRHKSPEDQQVYDQHYGLAIVNTHQ